jgi:hypothetical protein
MRLFLAAVGCLILGSLIGLRAAWYENAIDPGLDTYETADQSGAIKASGPKIVVEGGETYDFGSMEYPGSGKHEFVVRNDGDAPLILNPGKETCRCTISEIADKTVPPGGKTTLTLSWKPKPEDELFSNGVDVETNDPQKRSIRFRAVGRVVRALRWFPETVVMTNVTATEGGKGTLRLYTFSADDLQLTEHEFLKEATAKFFTLETRPLKPEELEDKKAKAGLELIVVAKNGLPLGPIDQELRILTDLPDGQPITLPVRGNVNSEITLIGAKVVSEQNLISFGTLPHGEGIKASTFLLVKGPHRNDVELKLKSVDPENVLKVKLDAPQGKETQVVRHALHVEIPPDAPSTIRLGTDVAPYGQIVLETTHPDIPLITIRVRFAIE